MNIHANKYLTNIYFIHLTQSPFAIASTGHACRNLPWLAFKGIPLLTTGAVSQNAQYFTIVFAVLQAFISQHLEREPQGAATKPPCPTSAFLGVI